MLFLVIYDLFFRGCNQSLIKPTGTYRRNNDVGIFVPWISNLTLLQKAYLSNANGISTHTQKRDIYGSDTIRKDKWT